MGEWPAIAALVSLCASCTLPESSDPPPLPPRGAEAAEIQVHLALSPPWSVAHESDEALILRYGAGPHGARLQLRPGPRGRPPGLSPILSGRTLEVASAGTTWPMLSPSFGPVQRAEVLTQAQDLVVRLYGPPLDRLLTHPDAPEDPALAWLRLRPRGDTWRLAAQGLVILSLPSDGLEEEVRAGDTVLQSAWGELVLESEHTARRGQGNGRWWLDTLVSPQTTQPYPELGVTWTPRP